MTMSKHVELAKALVRDEGLRFKPYRCTAGKLTIGIGRNLDDRGITKAEAFALLENDIDSCIADLDGALAWWRKLDEVRQEVLINMCFNMGIGSSSRGLLSFKNTLRMIESGDYAGAAAGMLNSRWATQVGARARRLSEQMRTGKRQ